MISASELKNALHRYPALNSKFSMENIKQVARGLSEVQEYQKTSYENAWKRHHSDLNYLIEKDKNFGTVTTRMLQNLALKGLTEEDTQNHNILHTDVAKQMKYELEAFENSPNKRLVASRGQYKLFDSKHIDFTLIDCLLQNLDDKTDTVIEFGSGWGANLAQLLMGSGRSKIKYVACEQSEAGRQCSEKLFSLLPRINFKSHEFDFLAPDFNMLKGCGKILAFTCAAIEQIAFLPASFFENLLKIEGEITLVFYEPIGWQRFTDQIQCNIELCFKELSLRNHPETWHLNNHVFRFADKFFIQNSASWSLAARYNINLLNLIKSVIDDKEATLVAKYYDVFGLNPVNPYSLFVLKKINNYAV